jgi:predicted transcriptional regulator
MPVKQVRVELYRPVIKSVLHEMAGKETFRVTMRVLSRAQVLCPVDQGNLRAAHGIKFKSTETRQIGEVNNKVKYALPVHEGRRQLVIYPKKKQALAFHWHGQPMVRKWVNQPARRGKPWLRDALREVAAQEGYKMQSTAATDSGGTL